MRNTIKENVASAESGRNSTLLKRILSGIVLVIITASSLFFGGGYLFILCLAISLIGMMELYRVAGIHKRPMAVLGYISAVSYFLTIYFGLVELTSLIFVVSCIMILTDYVLSYPKYDIKDSVITFFGLIYVAVMLSYIYQTRAMENGIFVVWLIFVSSWGNDTCAYFTGVFFGKHKMAPHLSPKKTVEGAVGGIVGAALLGGIYGFVISNDVTMLHPVYAFAAASAGGALLSIVGDLAASAIKRNYEIKDYGKLIPGHGGILDRYDSVIFTAPAVFWVFYFVNLYSANCF